MTSHSSPLVAALRRHPLLAVAFALASLLALAFAGSLVWRIAYWETHENEPIEPWMTVGYVGRSWDLDPRAIDEVAGLPTPEIAGRPLTLSEVARMRGVPVAEVIAEVEATVAELRSREAERRQGDGPGRDSGERGGGSGEGQGTP